MAAGIEVSDNNQIQISKCRLLLGLGRARSWVGGEQDPVKKVGWQELGKNLRRADGLQGRISNPTRYWGAVSHLARYRED